MDIDLQETTKFYNIQVSLHASNKHKISSETSKIYKVQDDPFPTCLDHNSATGFKKKNYLKASTRAAM